MLNVIKANFYKLSKNRLLKFATIGLLVFMVIFLGILTAIEFFKGDSVSNLINGAVVFQEGIASIEIFSILFGALAIIQVSDDYQDGLLKNVFSKGIGRSSYFLGNSIAISSLAYVFFIIYLIISVGFATYFFGWGELKSIGLMFLNLFTVFCLLVAIITLAMTSTILLKKSGKAVLLFGGIALVPYILEIFNIWMKINFNFKRISLFNQINQVSTEILSINSLITAILLALGYIFICSWFSIFLLKKQDIK